jgi:hypothetical protein
MAYGAFAETKSRYRDLEELVDYRAYDGAWTLGFEELASADANSSYAQQKVMESNPASGRNHRLPSRVSYS